MLVGAALLSHTIVTGYRTDDDKRAFFLYHNTSTALLTLATAWSKVSFAITLSRIVRHRALRYFLWFVIITANLIMVPGMMSIWIPACSDPRRFLRPAHAICFKHIILQYLGGATIGG